MNSTLASPYWAVFAGYVIVVQVAWSSPTLTPCQAHYTNSRGVLYEGL